MGLLRPLQAFGHAWLRLRGVRTVHIDSPVGRLHYYDAPGTGTLPTLVLQHGIGAGSAIQFALHMLLLRRHHRRVIVPDLPGHGLSDASPEMSPEVVFAGFAEVLDRTLAEPAVLYGNSLGGAMAVQYARMRPERVRGLFLASPAGAAIDPQEAEHFLRGFDMPDDDATMRFFARLYHRVPPGARFLAGDIRAIFNQPHMRALFEAIRPHHFFTPEVVAGLTAPTLLLWGRSDRVMLPSMLAFYRQHLPPGSVVEEPEGVGHCPHLDRPRWTARRILAFSRSLS